MDKPFDRTNIGLRERPLSSDHNRQFSQSDRTVRELLRALLSDRASDPSSAIGSRSGLIADGLRVMPANPVAMSVQVNAGYGFIYDPIDLPSDIGAPDLESVDDLSPYKPIFLANPATFAVPAAPLAPNTRIDIIEIRSDRRLEDSLPRRQLDVATRQYLDHNFYKTLAFGLDGRTGVVNNPAVSVAGLSYKIGTSGNPGVAPTVTPGYMKLAEVHVDGTTVTVNGSNLLDARTLLGIGGTVRGSVRWRQRWNGGAPIVDLQSVNAPPGVDIGVWADNGSGDHNSGALYVAAGSPTRAAFHIQCSEVTTAFRDMMPLNRAGIGGPLDTVRAGNLAAVQSTGLLAAIGQPILAGIYAAVIAASGVSNSAHLDDLQWHAFFELSYH